MTDDLKSVVAKFIEAYKSPLEVGPAVIQLFMVAQNDALELARSVVARELRLAAQDGCDAYEQIGNARAALRDLKHDITPAKIAS